MQNLTVIIILVISGLLILSAATKLVSKYSNIPYTILLVIAGFLLSFITKQEHGIAQQLSSYKIYPDILLYVCLPTLIFEAAFTMDGRLLRQNLIPVLTLAVPGLIVSMTVIGLIITMVTPLALMPALLLGAILSSTDSVAIISILRQIGVPKRLSILIEGESLFNSSTAFVIAKTLLFIMLSTAFSAQTILVTSLYQFSWNFFGGIIVGLILTLLMGLFISSNEEDTVVSIALTVILAYLSFIVSEKIFHVSGVMATITAGVMMADWGKTRLSTTTEKNIKNILSFFAYIVNSLIFLLVGFSINAVILIDSLYIILAAIIATLIARAVMVFGLTPLLCKLPNFQPISFRYQTITWWGGIQGAIGLTMVLGLRNLPNHDILISVVMGTVLFTILVQGFSMGKLIHWLKLDKPPLSEKLATLEAQIIAEKMTLAQIPELQSTGLFSLPIANELKVRSDKNRKRMHEKLRKLKNKTLTPVKEKKLLFISCLAEEKYLYHEMFINGHLGEQAYRILDHNVDMEIDLIRYHGEIGKLNSPSFLKNTLQILINILAYVPFTNGISNQLRIHQSISDYEVQWGMHQGSLAILSHLAQIDTSQNNQMIFQEVRETFIRWHHTSELYLMRMAEQFPEFVKDMQYRFAKRILLRAKFESIWKQVHQGLLPQHIADKLLQNYSLQIQRLSKEHPEKLTIDPHD